MRLGICTAQSHIQKNTKSQTIEVLKRPDKGGIILIDSLRPRLETGQTIVVNQYLLC